MLTPQEKQPHFLSREWRSQITQPDLHSKIYDIIESFLLQLIPCRITIYINGPGSKFRLWGVIIVLPLL